MENNQIFMKPCSAAFNPPENNFFPGDGNRFIPPANNHQTPPMTSFDQSFERAFSGLSLSSDGQLRSQESLSRSDTAAVDDGIAESPVSILQPMAFGGSHQIWAPPQFANASVGGPFGVTGAHQRIEVGSAVAARGPYFPAGDQNQLMHYNQRQDFYGAYCGDFGRVRLHGEEPVLMNPRHNVPVYAPWENGSYDSWSNDPLLYKRHRHLTLEDMRGGIVSYAKDQVMSEVLNSELVGLTEKQIDMILLELRESWRDLFRNQFGSQFVQNLFAVCSEAQMTRIIIALTKFQHNLVTICMNPFGARAIKMLLERLRTPQQVSLVMDSITRGALALATDPDGQNVIHYCVKSFPAEYTKRLLTEIARNCYRIAANKSGCCVMPPCLDHSRGEAREQLIRQIITYAAQLAEDPYGNYVVQHLIGMKMQEVTNHLLQRFQGFFLHLSCNKYGSNVVEKMIESGEDCCNTIVSELLTSPIASMLLLDPFGNYVIQSALSAAKGRVAHDMLITLVRENLQSMQSNIFGKKVLAWFAKRRLLERLYSSTNFLC